MLSEIDADLKIIKDDLGSVKSSLKRIIILSAITLILVWVTLIKSFLG